MAGVNRSPPAEGSSLHLARKVQPPRPPNAWILYRSNKFALIRQTEGRLSQATVSKIISDMWKKETEEVKRHWEREADDRKAEHQRLYPDYHYAPQKREERLRAKAESKKSRRAKKSKARNATPPDVGANATAIVSKPPPPPYMPQAYLVPGRHPHTVPPQAYVIQLLPEAYYGPNGPSPPISAAPSPVPYESSESPEVQPCHTTSSSSSSSARPSPRSESQTSSSSSQLPPDSLYFSSLPGSHQPSPNAYVPQPLPTPLFQSPAPSELPQTSPESQYLATKNTVVSSTPVFPVQPSGFNFQNSKGVAKFNIPISQPQNISQFPQSLCNSSLLGSAQGVLPRTGANGVFNLGNVDTSALLVAPQGDLEVTMGPQASTVDYNRQHFTDFDYIAFQQQMASFAESDLSSTAGGAPFPEDFQAFFHTPNVPDVQGHTTVRQREPSIFTQDMMDFLNFEAVEGFTEDTSTVSPVPNTVAPQQARIQSNQYATTMPVFNQMTNTPTVPSGTPYVPPAGAALSSMRRVAASWKPPSTIHPSPTEGPVPSWMFSTN